MGLFGRARVSAGLDIGSGFIKLVVVDHSKAEPEIVQVATSPLVPDAIVEGEVMDPVLVAETVRAVIDSVGIKKANVVAAVGGHDVIVKPIPMDRMSEQDAREVIRWEAEQHVPFDMENVQLDFQILDPEGTGPQMRVLLVAAKRELIENRMSLLSDAGIQPAIIDVDAFAIHNAFETVLAIRDESIKTSSLADIHKLTEELQLELGQDDLEYLKKFVAQAG